MAVLQRVALQPNERLDTPDIRAFDAFGLNDWRYFLSGFFSPESYILTGFEISNYTTIFSVAGFQITLDDVVLFYPQATTQAAGFYVFSGTEQDVSVNLSPGATNFIEVTLSNSSGTPDVRAFWDQGANGGLGGEFTETIDTVINLELTVTSNITGFTDTNIPLYRVVTNSSGVVTSVTDCRNLLFRLGTGGDTPDPANSFNWPSLPDSSHSRLEPSVTATSYTTGNAPFQGGDKNITTFKEWMDAIMSSIKELKGTPYWYMLGGGSSTVPSAYQNAALLIFEGGVWGNSISFLTTTGSISTTSSPNVITSVASTTGLAIGDFILGIDIPSGTTVTGFTSSTVTMSENALATVTGESISFAPASPGNLSLVGNCTISRLGFTNSLTLNQFSSSDPINLSLHPSLYILLPMGDTAISYGMGNDGLTPIVPEAVISTTPTSITVADNANYIQAGGTILCHGQTFTYTSYTPGSGLINGVSPDPSGIVLTGDYLYQLDTSGIGYYHYSSQNAAPNIVSGVSYGAERTVYIADYDGSLRIYVRSMEIRPLESRLTGDGLSTQTKTYIGATNSAVQSPGWKSLHSAPLRTIAHDGTDVTTAVASVDTQIDHFFGQFRIQPHPTNHSRVTITGVDYTMLDNTVLSQVIQNLIVNFTGAQVDFSTGSVYQSDGVTNLGLTFSPFTIPTGDYFWYSLNIIAGSVGSDNRTTVQFLVLPAASANPIQANAPYPPLSASGTKIGAVQVQNISGTITVGTIRQLGVGSGGGGGSGATEPNWFQEAPVGAVNGSNTNFALTNTPIDSQSVMVTVDGLVIPYAGWSLSGNVVVFNAGYIPQVGQNVYVYYLYTLVPTSITITGYQEIPSGTIDGTNAVFTITHLPDTGTLFVFLDGLIVPATEYSLNLQTITFGGSYIPQPGQDLYVFYQYDASLLTSTFTGAQEVPSGPVNGVNNIFNLSGIPTNKSSMVVTVDGTVLPGFAWDLVFSGTVAGVAFLTGYIPQTGQLPYVFYFINTAESIGGGFANTALSNLIAPTSVNADLLPDNDNFRDLGSSTDGWENGYIYFLKNVVTITGKLGEGLTAQSDGVFLLEGFNTNVANPNLLSPWYMANFFESGFSIDFPNNGSTSADLNFFHIGSDSAGIYKIAFAVGGGSIVISPAGASTPYTITYPSGTTVAAIYAAFTSWLSANAPALSSGVTQVGANSDLVTATGTYTFIGQTGPSSIQIDDNITETANQDYEVIASNGTVSISSPNGSTTISGYTVNIGATNDSVNLTSGLNAQNNPINNVPDPVSSQQPVTLNYFNAHSGGGGSGTTPNVEYRTLTSLEATNQQLTLAATPFVSANTLLDVITGSSQIYASDYIVTTNVLSWGSYGLSGFLNAGDILRIVYFT